MKFFSQIFWGIFVLAISLTPVVAGETNSFSAKLSNFSDQQILQTWGWMIAQDKNLAGVEISKSELAVFLKGFSDGVMNKSLAYEPKIFPDIERISKMRREKVVRAIIQKNQKEADIFFAKLKADTNIASSPGKFCYEIIKPGRGAFPKLRQTVTVHYTARLIDGTEFAQMGPIDVVLVTNRSICRGWVETLQKINKGGVIKLYVPPPLSEDEAFKWGIQPGSAMIFEIELLDIKDTSAEDLENATLPPAPEPPPPLPSGYSGLEIIEAWGWSIARDARADKFELSEDECRLLVKGLAAGIEGKPPPFDLEKIYPAVEKFVGDRQERIHQAEQRKRIDEMNLFFAGLKQNTNIVELPDGLRYEIVKAGGAGHPEPGQIVLVDYTGRLLNGTIFDKTYNEPLHIEVGSVISGFNEGIQKIGKGGKIKLYVPPSLGYGDENRSGVVAPIPANSVLIYEIELLDIQDAPHENN